MAKYKSKAKRDPHAEKPRSEREAILYEVDLNKYIAKHDGRYVRADDGSLQLIVGDLRIPLAFDRNNHGLAKLMLDACDVTSLSPGAQAAIQRLQVRAQRSASGLSIRHFAALSADRRRLYIPVYGSKLLKITAESIDCASNFVMPSPISG